MPRNKRESLIYTVLMCFTMVLWMSIYNVTLHMGALNLTTIREAWIGFRSPMCLQCAWTGRGLRTGEGICVPLPRKTGEPGASQGARGFLFHGGSDGDYYVPLRCP